MSMGISFSRLLAAAAAVAALCSCSTPKVYDVRLSGEGVDLFPDSSRVLVFRKGADFRFDDPAEAPSTCHSGTLWSGSMN